MLMVFLRERGMQPPLTLPSPQRGEGVGGSRSVMPSMNAMRIVTTFPAR